MSGTDQCRFRPRDRTGLGVTHLTKPLSRSVVLYERLLQTQHVPLQGLVCFESKSSTNRPIHVCSARFSACIGRETDNVRHFGRRLPDLKRPIMQCDMSKCAILQMFRLAQRVTGRYVLYYRRSVVNFDLRTYDREIEDGRESLAFHSLT
jgi:hypothetical protein